MTHHIVVDADKLINLFGSWPTFHDSEVLECVLRRNPEPTLLMRITAFERTTDVDGRGYYIRRHECVVTLGFDGVRNVLIEGFNEQNVLAELTLTEQNTAVSVVIAGLYGLNSTFTCDRVRVLAVERLPKTLGTSQLID